MVRATGVARTLLLPVLEVEVLAGDGCSVSVCRDSAAVLVGCAMTEGGAAGVDCEPGAGCAVAADFAQRPELDAAVGAAGDGEASDAARAEAVPGVVGFGGALAAGGGDAAGAGRAGGAVGIADFATGFTGVAARVGAVLAGSCAGRLAAAASAADADAADAASADVADAAGPADAAGADPAAVDAADAGGTAVAPGFIDAAGRAVGAPVVVGLTGRVGAVVDPGVLGPGAPGDVGAAPAADAVGAIDEGRAGAMPGRSAADGGKEARATVPAPAEEAGFAVLLAAATADSATPVGFRVAGATVEIVEDAAAAAGVGIALGAEPEAFGVAAEPDLAPAALVGAADARAVGAEPAAEPPAGGVPEVGAALTELVDAVGTAAKPPSAPAAAAEALGEGAYPSPATEPAAAGVEPPLAGVASELGTVASLGPKSVGSNNGDAQVPEYMVSIGAVAHDPDDEVSEAACDEDSNVVVALAAFAAVDPAAAAAPGLFAAGAVAFVAGAAAPGDLVELALLPGPAAPGSTVGMPNPAGEAAFCGSFGAALLVAARGAGVAAAAG